MTLVPIYLREEPGVDYAELTDALAVSILEICGEGGFRSVQTLLIEEPLDTLELLLGNDGFFEIEQLALPRRSSAAESCGTSLSVLPGVESA